MWQQIRVIAWVQFLAIRNRLPKSNAGTVLTWVLTAIWYSVFAGSGLILAIFLPRASKDLLDSYVPTALLSMMLFWQIVPLVTLSSGWSLQLSKLQIYPIKTSALFTIEVILRLTGAPEMIFVLVGAVIGLLRNPTLPAGVPLILLAYIPINLLLSLGVRELLLRSVQQKRFRSLRTIVVLAVAVAPQLIFRTSLGTTLRPYFMHAGNAPGTPWFTLAALTLGNFSLASVLFALAWIAVSYVFARWQFAHSLLEEEGAIARPAKDVRPQSKRRTLNLDWVFELPNRFTGDPMAALLQKEFRSLVRMPRFRLVFGMACIFSVVVFIPMILRGSQVSFITNNFLPVVTMYGLLILGEVLLFNVFGFDRKATQLYVVTPVPFDAVLRAKNLVAAFFALLQAIAVLMIAALVRIHFSVVAMADSLAVSAVVAVFLMSVGNLTSVMMPRPVDPNQTFRRQTSGKMQLWLLLSFVGLTVPIGLAFLARYAFDNEWAFFGVLAIDFAIGIVVYRLATESALQRAMRNSEWIIESLSKGADPISS